MAKRLLTAVLDHLKLADYVDGLQPDQMRASIWKGDLELRNLQLKRDAMDALDLPARVLSGSLDRLHVSIPRDVFNESIQVTIDGLYVLIGPPAAGVGEERALRSKRQRLQRAAEISSMQSNADGTGTAEGGKSDKGGMFSWKRVRLKILDNLKVVFTNIHVRYEEHYSTDQNNVYRSGVSFGLTASRFMIQTGQISDRNACGMEAGAYSGVPFMHKVLSMENTAVYWTCMGSGSPSGISSEFICEHTALDTAASSSDKDQPNFRALMRSYIDGQQALELRFLLHPSSAAVRFTKQ